MIQPAMKHCDVMWSHAFYSPSQWNFRKRSGKKNALMSTADVAIQSILCPKFLKRVRKIARSDYELHVRPSFRTEQLGSH